MMPARNAVERDDIGIPLEEAVQIRIGERADLRVGGRTRRRRLLGATAAPGAREETDGDKIEGPVSKHAGLYWPPSTGIGDWGLGLEVRCSCPSER